MARALTSTRSWSRSCQADKLSAAAADYDWIGFDPRGVGSSIPGDPVRPELLRRRPAELHPATTTMLRLLAEPVDSVRQGLRDQRAARRAAAQHDDDRLRQGHGQHPAGASAQQQINYYGFSYGTYLGQVYSTLYPTHVRPDDPGQQRRSPRRLVQGQPRPGHRVQPQHQASGSPGSPSTTSVYHLGTTEQAVEKPGTREPGHARPRAPTAGWSAPTSGPTRSSRPATTSRPGLQLGSAFADWVSTTAQTRRRTLVERSTRAPTTRATTTSSPSTTRSSAPTSQWPTSWAEWQRDNNAVNKKSPFETWDNAWFNAPCLHWPAPRPAPVQVERQRRTIQQRPADRRDAATRRRRSRAASRSASCSRTPACSPSRAAPPTPTRCSATSASTARSPVTWRPGSCRRARPTPSGTSPASRCRSPTRRLRRRPRRPCRPTQRRPERPAEQTEAVTPRLGPAARPGRLRPG